MFDRLELLVGKDGIKKLKEANITVLGLGGVGSYLVEALIRSGIENITIIDFDKIEISNLNRQLMATTKNIGKFKIDEIEKRIKENIDKILNENIDYFIDCCDTINTKKEVIKKCILKNIKFITCLGTGKRMDPSKLMICDLRKTSYDPIAKILRKYLKDENIKEKVTCCYSSEIPMKIDSKKIASNGFVPASAGLLIASYIVKEIALNKKGR